MQVKARQIWRVEVMARMEKITYRPVKLDQSAALVTQGQAGVQYVSRSLPLAPYAERMVDRLAHWAHLSPDKIFLAERERLPEGLTGDWVVLTYSQAWSQARSIASYLLGCGLSVERPLAILSGNSLHQALVTLGAMIVGIPVAPVSPAYALLDKSYGKLRHVLSTVTPGMVYVDDGSLLEQAINATVAADVQIILERGSVAGRTVSKLSDLLAWEVSPAVDLAMQATGPDTIVKFLFTSGSTRSPRAVVNTNRMWCANMLQIGQCLDFPGPQEIVMVDWLPWHHTFGGNHNFGLALYFGGSFYLDAGRPTLDGMPETLRNLREIAPTLHLSVPSSLEMLAQSLKIDTLLRKTFLSRLRMFLYAGASLSQSTWDSLIDITENELGVRIPIFTGLGMTETAPMAICSVQMESEAGDLGLPTPGMEVKLMPQGDKLELRYRGPNVTPGYWRAPEERASHFDEEGYFCSGDAVRWIDPTDPGRGLRFDGRIAEDFKLATGTFVSVGHLRAAIIAASAPYVHDVVLTGLDRNELGAMLFVSSKLRELAGLAPTAKLIDVYRAPTVSAFFQAMTDRLSAAASGSSNRIARLCLLVDPPSLAMGECTDKGSINQRAVLSHRAALVDQLYAGSIPWLFLPNA